jgi:Mg/Co/Ni transporter MgtE
VYKRQPDDDQEDVAEAMSKYDLLALPVVDETGKLLGIVTVDDALTVLEEESAEDLELATGRREGFAVTGLWRWVSRDGWLVVWGVAFLAAAGFARWTQTALQGNRDADLSFGLLPLIAVLLSPVVLRIAEDVASHAMSRVIEANEGSRDPLLRRLALDGLSGLGLGALLGLLVFGTIDLAFGASAEAKIVGLAIGAALGLSAFIVTLVGTLVGRIAERRAASDRRVSQLGVAVILMSTGLVSSVGLLVVAAIVSSNLTGR